MVVLIHLLWLCQSKFIKRGYIHFLILFLRSLGRLNYMRIWHDNSGSRNKASWFLKYIIVRDLQTMEKNHFICQQWLAVEKYDGLVRLIKKDIEFLENFVLNIHLA